MGVVCQILINKPCTGIHFAGGTVSGIVKYAIDEPTEYKDIVLSFKGESYCSWSETDSDDNSKTYTGREEHVSQVVSLLGKLASSTLPAGSYEHKFLFTLPRNIPSSFNQATGNVTYQILLEFKKDGLFNLNKKFDAKIPVQSFLEPTLPDTAIVFGVHKDVLKPFTFGNHKISLKAVIDTPYLKPGDTAHLKFIINNNSIIRIKCIRAELFSRTVFTASCGRTSSSTKKISGCMAETEEIPPYQKSTLETSVRTFPHLYSVQYSKVVKHEFKILVSVVLGWPHWNARVEMPVLIGWKEGQTDIEKGSRSVEMDIDPPEYNSIWQDMDEYNEKSKSKEK